MLAGLTSAACGRCARQSPFLITVGCAEPALAACLLCLNMQLGFIPCQTNMLVYADMCVYADIYLHPSVGRTCSQATPSGYLCHQGAPTACPGCAPAIQTCWSGIKSHLRPLVHPVGLPRKQAFLSRLSPGPARGCVLLPMNCRPSMEMGSSRLLSLISTLQKSEEKVI